MASEMPDEIRVAPDRESISSGDWVHGEWWVGPGGTRYYRHDLAAAQDARIADLEAALRKLRNEIGGLSAFEREVRAAIGNTNWSVLSQRIAEADDALGSKP